MEPSEDARDDVPNDGEMAALCDALMRDRSALDRIGLGLRALHNHPLFERLPDEFRALIDRLQKTEHTKEGE